MTRRFGFERLIHSDWSKQPKKRWSASAIHRSDHWHIDSLENVFETRTFLSKVAEMPPTLAGFDFVIGFPAFYQAKLVHSFPEWLKQIDAVQFSLFADIATSAAQIADTRPFYPRNQLKNPKQRYLFEAHKCSRADLFRQCELRTANRNAGSPLFWTLGAKQVGRAALTGWRDILRPALLNDARLWPFHGTLGELQDGPLVICETYPGEAYHHVGLHKFRGKRKQEDRRRVAQDIFAFLAKRNVRWTVEIGNMISNGFGGADDGEDRFDALVGLMSMIEVVEGHRPESSPSNQVIQRFEGWILGQIDLPLNP